MPLFFKCDISANDVTTGLARGFTLLELMVTLAVAAVVLTVAVPSFTGLLVRNALTAETNEFVAAFSLARNEAIKLNQNIRFCHSGDGVNCSEPGGLGWQGWIIIDPADRVIARGFFSSTLSITGSANTNIMQFTANGLVRNGANGAPLGGTFTICSGSTQVTENARLLNFVSGGRISIATAQLPECA